MPKVTITPRSRELQDKLKNYSNQKYTAKNYNKKELQLEYTKNRDQDNHKSNLMKQ